MNATTATAATTTTAFNNATATTSSPSSSSSSAADYLTLTLIETCLIAIFACFLSILTIVGNVLVMISFKMDKQLQTISNYFLLSLSIADFLIGLISMPLYTLYYLLQRWPLGSFICDTWLAIDYLISNASVLNLIIISFDRYFSVTRPLTYRVRRTTRRACVMIATAWIISLLLWPPWIYSWPYIEGKRTVPQDKCYIQFLETNSLITFATAIAAFYIPVTIMAILYWRIWRETEKRYKDLTTLFLVSTVGQPKQHHKLQQETSISEAAAELSDAANASSSPSWFRKFLKRKGTNNNGDHSNGQQHQQQRPPQQLTQQQQQLQPLSASISEQFTTTLKTTTNESIYTILIQLDQEHQNATIKMIEDQQQQQQQMQQQPSTSSFRRHYNSQRQQSSKTSTSTTSTSIHPPKSERKAAKTLSAILLAFIITWLPYNVLVLIKNVFNNLPEEEEEDVIPKALWDFCYYLCYINSTVNPLCYALCNATFRRTYIRILKCKWRSQKKQRQKHWQLE